MEQPTQFRSAFNGFNREDVVRYLEFINNKHSAQVAQLNNELDYLRKRQETMDESQVPSLETKLAEAERENRILRGRVASLEDDLRNAEKNREFSSKLPNAAELEAYRRAERVERLAKTRANQIGEETTAVLADAGSKVEEASACVEEITTQVTAQLDQLRDAMTRSQQAFRDATQILSKLHGEIEE